MSDRLLIRLPEPARDAARVAEIYRPSVESGLASFEEVPPDAVEMRRRIAATLAATPWLVAEVDSRVAGYAYAGPHHTRPGYRWSVNVSVYVAEGFAGRGIGRRLYRELFAILTRQGFVNVYAGITLPNDASVALHRSMGMEPVGTYQGVGFKHGAWHDVAWFGLRLAEPLDPPPAPIALPDLDQGA